jgi:hypothetical protein
MGKAVERWVADDGTEFDSKKDMLIHELTLLDEKEIDVFLTAFVSPTSKRTTEYKKLLIQWQKHIRAQDFDVINSLPAPELSAEVENIDPLI